MHSTTRKEQKSFLQAATGLATLGALTLAVLSVLPLIAIQPAHAQTETVLYSFAGGQAGGYPTRAALTAMGRCLSGVLVLLVPWTLWHLVATLSSLLSLVCFGLTLFLMFKAYRNERFRLPLIGDLAEKQA